MRVLTLMAAGVLASGCVTYALRTEVRPRSDVQDSSAGNGAASGAAGRSFMVLPGAESNRGALGQPDLSVSLERGFLNRQVKVISPGVTARVVLQEKKGEAASQLSDLERALILAKDTGADAVLQVGTLTVAGFAQRFYCGPEAGPLTECSSAEFYASRQGRAIGGELLSFTGRLIDTKSGEILQALRIEVPVVNGLNCTLVAPENTEPRLVVDCRNCPDDSWWCQRCKEASSRSFELLIDTLFKRVTGGQSAAEWEAPPAAPATGRP